MMIFFIKCNKNIAYYEILYNLSQREKEGGQISC